ncbi:site-2 protease family protein [Actinokineospora auranticolor]|uniref:RIP metalloprotease RseP n=1 Tax=Actinokineospora auranticolor TaxID=155976 RepID=A0A2S6GFG7_9PSEU|nr:site-2 protease family protein [Actinokineospora auranticolor]PPK63964.1 RIP metalloprotease RseP [Actinokineospora auranticolor]
MFYWLLGLVLFALGICLSVALHEAGHMLTAKWFGMRVRRYFIGFGPTLFSFRRGETEYGLKAIPAGGFCDIAGMTALDQVTAEEAPRAMWRFAAWKRVIVMSAGSITHFLLGFIILYLMAVTMGLPTAVVGHAVVGNTSCAAATQDPKTLKVADCTAADASPAAAAGVVAGDRIVSVQGQKIQDWNDLVVKIRALRGPTDFVIEHDGAERTVSIDVRTVQRLEAGAAAGKDNKPVEVGAIGIERGAMTQYSALAAVPATVEFTGEMFVSTWQGLMKFPEKIPAVIRAIGGENDPERPVSVVGASIIGADAAEQGIWEIFVFVLAALNFFVGVFNLLPLLPLDGGHIAIIFYEKIRDALRRARGKAPAGPVDYNKLAGITMVLVVLGGAVVLLTVTADIVNPIRLP